MRAAAAFLTLYLLLVAAAMLAHRLLAALGLAGWERWLGIGGAALILVSFLYSLRKRKILRRGRPPAYLRLHETLAWSGAVLVLVHGGTHHRALLPWLAQISMLVVVASGLVGKYLLQRSRQGLAGRRKELAAAGHEAAEIESRLLFEAVLVDAMTRWRKVHVPLTFVFAVSAFAHALSALLFWRW